jgi:tetratricopeptide (TPR) repeat protein
MVQRSGFSPLLKGAVLGLLLTGGVAAGCGGAEPGPAAGPPAGGPPPADSASSSAAPAAALDDAPAAAPSADQQAGIKAFDAGNYADARKAFEAAVKKNPKDFASYQDLGASCEKLGDKVAAEMAYKSAIAIKPDLDTAAANLSALYLDQGRVDDALAVARTGLAKHPGSGALHENMGIALASRGDQDNATKEFSAAVQSAPSDPMMHLTFAQWLNTWKVRGATPHLDAARTLAKDDYGMLASIGLEYRRAGEFDSCVKTFDHAIQIKDGGEVRTERALCKLGLKDEKGTLDDLQAAVDKEPSYAPGHYYLGGRLAKQKKFKEAASEYAKYLELAPSGSLAGQATERLKASQDAMAKDKGGAKKK